MGRIKSLLVKRTAKQLVAKEMGKFDETFETNKRILANTMPSKSTRNKIAGYIARIIRMKKDEVKKQEKLKLRLEQNKVEDEKLQAEMY